MSLLLLGLATETKPPSPRLDIPPNTEGGTPKTHNYTYRMYSRDISPRLGLKEIAFAFHDDLITRHQPKPHTLFTAMQNLRDWLKNNTKLMVADDVARYGYAISIDPIVGKSSISLFTTAADTDILETDLTAGRVHLCMYVEKISEQFDWSRNLIFNALTRMMELAREKNYFWQDECIRNLAPVGGDFTEGQTLTVVFPTWIAPNLPTVAWWMKDGVVTNPKQSGFANFTKIAELSDAGNYQVKAGIDIDDVTTTAQWRTSEFGVVTITPAIFLVTETGAENIEGEDGTLLIAEE